MSSSIYVDPIGFSKIYTSYNLDIYKVSRVTPVDARIFMHNYNREYPFKALILSPYGDAEAKSETFRVLSGYASKLRVINLRTGITDSELIEMGRALFPPYDDNLDPISPYSIIR